MPAKCQAALAALVLAAVVMVCASPVAWAQPAREVESDVTRVDVAPPRSVLEMQPLRRNGSTAVNSKTATRPTTQKAGVRTAGGAAGTSGFDAGRVAFALAAVVALIFLLRWVAKRFFGVSGVGRSTRAVQVLSRSPLSPRQQLVLLRVGRRLLVVADGGGQINTLSEITDPDEVAALVGQVQDDHADRGAKSFGAMFGKSRGSYEGHDDDDSNANATEAEPAALRRGGGDDDDPAAASARRELSGLMDRVRSLSRQFKGS